MVATSFPLFIQRVGYGRYLGNQLAIARLATCLRRLGASVARIHSMRKGRIPGRRAGWPRTAIFIITTATLWAALLYVGSGHPWVLAGASLLAVVLAPLPLRMVWSRREASLLRDLSRTSEQAEELRVELDTVRDRMMGLRGELAESDSRVRLANQLTILGRFTAGFLHEFNNPLAILTSRIEVLLEERKEDRTLCSDLDQMLKEARYMANISGTLLPALRRERGVQTFTPCEPAETLKEILASLGGSAEKRGVRLLVSPHDVPPVNLPDHVLAECLRALVSNAVEALKDTNEATIWLRIEPYHSPGSRVVVRVEDNGPGVPDGLREHLFEPFASSSRGRDHLGLGLFVAASLLDSYDGSLQYEPRPAGGARFSLELPPARFTKEQPYHWFVQEVGA